MECLSQYGHFSGQARLKAESKSKNSWSASPGEIRSDKLNAACCDSVNLTRQAVVNEFHGVKVVGGEVAEDLFKHGLCLPSGTAMTEKDLDRVVRVIGKVLGFKF